MYTIFQDILIWYKIHIDFMDSGIENIFLLSRYLVVDTYILELTHKGRKAAFVHLYSALVCLYSIYAYFYSTIIRPIRIV